MRLFLQLNILDWKEQTYEKPLLGYASSLADDLIGTDIDSQSDAHIAELVIKLSAQAESIFLLVIASADCPLGTALPIFNSLLKTRQKVDRAVLWGTHEMAAKMLSPFSKKFSREDNEEKIKLMIRDFAQGGLPNDRPVAFN